MPHDPSPPPDERDFAPPRSRNSAPPNGRDFAPPNERDSADLSVIIVNWNVRDLLRNCLNSLLASPGIAWVGGPMRGDSVAQPPDEGRVTRPPPLLQALSAEVIVLDNASSDGSTAMLEAVFPWVRLVASPENLGFTGGNNLAIPLSRGRYVFFLNPDTEVRGSALAAMVACMEGHPEIGVLGPELRYGDEKREGRMLRTARHKYVVFNGGARPEQFFDLTIDPGETQNLARHKSNAEILGQHRDLLRGWIAETHDDFSLPVNGHA